MSTLRKRNGKWQVQVRRTGCPHTSKSFNSKSDAAEWARLMEVRADSRELNRGFRALETVTLHDVLTRYLGEVVALKRCKANESIIINAMSRQGFCQQSLNTLSASHIAVYRDQRLRDVKPVTVNRELALLQHALDIAINEWNLPLNVNPVKRVKRPRNGDHRDRRLQFGEFRKLLVSIKRCRNPIMRPLVLFALVTGMRQGELLRINWDDFDRRKSLLLIPETKNGEPRTIPLSRRAVKIKCITQRRNQREDRMFPLTSEAVKKLWQRNVERAGIADLHFHDLRHEAISKFFERGLSVPEVALISGHKDMRMLFRYTHLKAESILQKL